MPITQVHTYDNGLTIGFDSDVNDWVRVDPQALEGSTAGNIVRGAGRSMEGIDLGLKEALGYDPAGTAQGIEQLRQQEEAASAGAPIASMVGGAVPDVAAGAALAGATGGMGLLPTIGAELGLGALLGGIRPGSVEDRAQNAAVTSLLTVAGFGMGAAASKGIGVALKAFGVVEDKMLGRIASTTEAAGTRLRTADEAAAVERQALDQPGSVGAAATPDEAAAVERQALDQPGSVGAAATPESELDQATRMENQALRTGDEAGADLMDDARMQQMADRAQELDMPVPIGFGSRAMSPARLGQAVTEMSPIGDIAGKRIMNMQKARTSQLLGEALGLPNASKKQALFTDDLNDARAEISSKFDQVRDHMPNMDGARMVRALESVGNSEAGVFGSFQSQKLIADAIENAKGRPLLNGKEVMNTRAALSEMMSDAFAHNKIASGEQLMQALNKIDDAIEANLKKSGKQRLADTWETARSQWRVLKMTEAPGAVTVGTGEVNPLSLFNRMNKPPSKGGWKGGRPPKGSPARRLYDALEIGVASQTGVPMTGARALIRDAMQSTVGKGAAGAVTGYSVWDALN